MLFIQREAGADMAQKIENNVRTIATALSLSLSLSVWSQGCGRDGALPLCVWSQLFDRYCSNNNFYIMSHLDGRIKDGEHRITDDVSGVLSRLGPCFSTNSSAPGVYHRCMACSTGRCPT
jgi:predicted 2-oxoglutarate/Fe(II)-dependent dioxygenase YbiX